MKNVFPVISVIIPVYNTKKEYLRECFESIEKQTLRDFDVIVVDDGSKPKTAKYLDSFTRRDGWRVIHQKNQGASVARQNGFDNSTGKYVLFLDADDIFMPNFFEKMFNTAKQNNSDVVMCWFNQFDSNTGKNVPNDYWTEGALSRLKNPLKYNYHDSPDEIFQTATANLWTKLLRRDMLVDHGVRFDNGLPAANDFPSVLALLISAKIISAIPDRLIKYRVNNPESTTAMHRTKGSLSSFMAARASKKFLDDHNIYEEVKGSFTEIAIGVMCWNLRDNIP
ncbi:MAG: glycosyltransferase, partial [Candidatus Nanoperiomorbaceae bacterium]